VNAIHKAGAQAIYILGGVPALALMAFGLDGTEPVDVLCGAGNRFVAEAKRQLFGRCGIDLLAGPTEILVIADDTADPALVACDLLGQAEHDPNSGVCLICMSEAFAQAAIAELEKQLAVLPTRDVAALAWRDQGVVYVAESEDEAIELSDSYAPEHLELHVRGLDTFAARLTNYGSLFIGEETTVAYGDKTIGTNHILPTSRAARYTGGLWVGKFLKTCTYQRMTREASVEVGEVTERQCNLENMLAHAITARVRVERYGGSE
jgi:sulfopropanediol 3-dehydrogenase